MEGNLGCYNNEVKVQLTISNTSLSFGNKKVIYEWFDEWIFFPSLLFIYTSLRVRALNFILLAESQN